MTATLVNLNTKPTCRVRALNPFSKEVIFRQNTLVGKAEDVENIVAIVAEAESEKVERVSIRRVNVSAEAAVSEAYEEADAKEVPDHLLDMRKRSTEGKDIKQKRIVAGLLKKYSDTFSKAEWDIGLTNVDEHSIDMGYAAPIKQRPRRVPMAYADEERKAIE
ncbi:hypothetical protein DPMN_112502 [Dreissena polymorpha]|uniref:Uncharacterized protein n=1 Tax=Dreissena polymorpha TaxID=45954 RepID=A0A9D4KGF1_DREPO|nr:hypothetical protein DPMN_112502 [Dreissena polymorpha]